ncbi:unnamed protein product [Zymoseptoria tritici ST99CH_1A5]|uniref:LDB19 N-terminal domain-containing protein n=2 Tax=Zymoseptoria tritici TaxID=1047171 RepID=A0A1X7RJK7_ZYMT9|nr:unnamed protein product [Zymoseptoria tritici ST99CH_3D7]SMY21284.1 unnamed protein product [Zymoseptoria tritici ST99CH_1A5]
MPARIFGRGLDFGRQSPPSLDPSSFPAKSNKSNSNSSLEVRSPSGSSSPTMDFKRPTLSLTKKHSSKDRKDRSLSKDKQSKPKDKETPRSSLRPQCVNLDLQMESPPVLMIDAPSQSSGALISGRLRITPTGDDTILESIAMYLECTSATKRPVADRCRECATQVKDLYEWNFLAKPKFFTAQDGVQELPFSHLIPGHLPATTHGALASIEYSLHVRARASTGEEVEHRRALTINRALRPGNDKNSIRVFPPTNLSLHVTLPNVVHPIGDFPVSCRMTGITTKRDDTQTRWRLRKLTWRIEEHEVAISPACSQHASKVGGEGKGLQHESTRDIGMDELKQGWKTDFSDGAIEGEFTCAIDTSARPQCSVEAPSGLKISHNLILELVIAEEWAPNKKPSQATPTGAARVLRTQFALNVTERAGMGIAWDDEQPPMYDDVPASPPHYQGERTVVVDYQGDDLEADVEALSLSP